MRLRAAIAAGRYIPEAAYHRPGAADKERAMAMHREGSSLRAIGRVFGVSAQAVTLGLKKGSPSLSRMRRRGENVVLVLPAFRRRR